MNLQPLEDRIVVRPAEAEETTISGLVIPDTAKEKPQQGEVLAVGPGRRAENSGELIAMEHLAAAEARAGWPKAWKALDRKNLRDWMPES